MPDSDPDKTPLPTPHVQGLDELFRDHSGNDGCNFPLGSTVVLSGPPGAGKTTMALALVRSMMCGDVSPVEAADPADETQKRWEVSPKHIAYYVSTEVNRDRLKKMYSGRGWFVDENDVRDRNKTKDKDHAKWEVDYLFRPDPEPDKTSGLHVINPPLEIERPVKTSEELVNYIVRQIAVESPPQDGQKVFIIVDSVTALFKDCKHPGQGRRQTHELTHRLQQQFSNTPYALGMIILLAEQGIENLGSPGMETYVADFVFNLGFKSLTMGTRLRTVEITKSQGANLMMGTHTWLIVTNQSLTRVIAGESLQEAIRQKVSRAECPGKHAPARWGTVVFLHRPNFFSLEEKREAKKDTEKDWEAQRQSPESASGIVGLDQMLKFDSDYWFSDPLEKKAPYRAIQRGSVTMLVGEAGTGKTSLCYHFVARHLLDHQRKGKALLVGFEQNFKEPFKRHCDRYRESGEELGKEDVERCETIYRPRSGLHFNLLLMEIRAWMKDNQAVEKRIAIDGISNLASIHSRQEFSQMLDALIYLIDQYPEKVRDDKTEADFQASNAAETAAEKDGKKEVTKKVPVKASLLLTYESAQAGSIFGSEAFRLPADNIVMLEHKDIEDDRRTAVTLIKSSHQLYDTMVRELQLNHNNPRETHIKSGFDAYSGLLSGKLRRATVVLQLFEENRLEDRFNKALQKQLRDLLPYQIALRGFSRFDISSTLDSVGTHIRVPHGDVLISNMDEWWLSHKVSLIQTAMQAELQKVKDEATDEEKADAEAKARQAATETAKTYQLVNLAGFVKPDVRAALKPGDFWCFEMEKCWRKIAMSQGEFRAVGPYALPSFLDFGMLCIHRTVVEKAEIVIPPGKPLPDWDNTEKVPWEARGDRQWFAALLQKYLLPWCEFKDDWFVAPDQAAGTLVQVMALEQKNLGSEGIQYGFAWDSRTPETAACVLYELAWAFGGSQTLFTDTKQNLAAVKRAFSFIGFLVQEGLMPAFPTLTDTSQAIFSRHYYSTLTDVNLRHQEVVNEERDPIPNTPNAAPVGSLISLGFMPPGPVDATTAARTADDQARFERLLRERAIPVNKEFKEKQTEETFPLERRKQLVKDKWKASQLSWSSATVHYDSPNPTDIEELIRWMDFRSQLDRANSWEELLITPEEIGQSPVYKCRTGHGCCGAWMVGVKGPAASPGLAQVVLQEITSLKFAKKRARLGAGIPARQDFYRYYGDRPVTGMEQFSWNEILCFLGSRANRRDRVYPTEAVKPPAPAHNPEGEAEAVDPEERQNSAPMVQDPAQRHKLIQHHLNHIMALAARRDITPEQITALADQCTLQLFNPSAGH